MNMQSWMPQQKLWVFWNNIDGYWYPYHCNGVTEARQLYDAAKAQGCKLSTRP